MSRTFRIIVNPASGGGRALRRVGPVARLLRDSGAEVTVVHSLGVAHSVEEVGIAAAAGETVVACGGDGMLASVAGAAIAHATPLGILPSGRGNDFARMLRLVDDTPEQVAHVLLEGDPTPVDVIDADRRIVLGSVYAGVDSTASEIVDRAHRLPIALQYPYAAVRALLSHRPADYTVTVDGSATEVSAYTVVVANSGFYGNGLHVAPAAVVDDGLLDVVVIPATSRWRLLRSLPSLYDGTHVQLPDLLTLRGTTVTVAAVSPVVAYGDGERLGPLPVTASVRPGSLLVLLP